ncbi:MAG: hypothetical protein HFI15_03210 [Lachnospiraceae bacterium]|jgi:hypothetical protein|nr:hypothetical protein [Lachnospiraceae bacterium]
MADAVITLKARKKMVQARAGAITLPPIVGMVFGTGGVDEAGMPVAPSGSDEGLKQEIFRKELDSYTFTDDTTCRYLCTLEVGECDNEEISEIGLYDSEGDITAIKTFKKKGKDSDLEMTFRIDDIF